jgi:hypothetical protein
MGFPNSPSARYVTGTDTPKAGKAASSGGQVVKKSMNSKSGSSHLGCIAEGGEGSLGAARSKRYDGDVSEDGGWREYRPTDSSSHREAEEKDHQVASTPSSIKTPKGAGPWAKGSKTSKSEDASRNAARGAVKIAILSSADGAREAKLAKERVAAVDHAWDMALSADG